MQIEGGIKPITFWNKSWKGPITTHWNNDLSYGLIGFLDGMGITHSISKPYPYFMCARERVGSFS